MESVILRKKQIFVAGKPLDLQKWESCILKRFQKSDLGPLLFFHASSRHWQLYLYLGSRGHLSNVWSQSSHWQPRSIQMHPTMNCFHHALFFFNIPENMSNRTLFFSSGMFHLLPSHQPLQPSDVWFSLCCALAIQTRLNSVQPPAFSSLCFHST